MYKTYFGVVGDVFGIIFGAGRNSWGTDEIPSLGDAGSAMTSTYVVQCYDIGVIGLRYEHASNHLPISF